MSTLPNSVSVPLKAAIYKLIFPAEFLTKANATVEVITPILTDIVEVVGGAVADLKLLVGAEVSVILASVDGTVQVTVTVIAQLLAEILCVSMIFFLSGHLLRICVVGPWRACIRPHHSRGCQHPC